MSSIHGFCGRVLVSSWRHALLGPYISCFERRGVSFFVFSLSLWTVCVLIRMAPITGADDRLVCGHYRGSGDHCFSMQTRCNEQRRSKREGPSFFGSVTAGSVFLCVSLALCKKKPLKIQILPHSRSDRYIKLQRCHSDARARLGAAWCCLALER